jgi:putative ABC transport system permease protein
MFGENLAIAFRALWANKMRSLLTTLGVVIGVAAVIAVVSIIQGFFFAVNDLFNNMGSGWVRVIPQRPDGPEFEKKIIRPLYRADIEYLRDHAPMVQDVAPAMYGSLNIKHGDRQSSTVVLGTTSSWMDIMNFYVDRGRFFTGIDDRQRRSVCVIGANIIEKLGLDEPIMGASIQIGTESFIIIGMMESRGELIGLNLDDYIFVPFNTAKVLYGEEQSYNTFWEVSISDPSRMSLAKGQMTDALRRLRRIPAREPDDFQLFTQA